MMGSRGVGGAEIKFSEKIAVYSYQRFKWDSVRECDLEYAST